MKVHFSEFSEMIHPDILPVLASCSGELPKETKERIMECHKSI